MSNRGQGMWAFIGYNSRLEPTGLLYLYIEGTSLRQFYGCVRLVGFDE